MKNSRNIVVSLSPADLHTVLQMPTEIKKSLCISANLSAETKEFVFITADGLQYSVPTSVFKSTDKNDVEWLSLELTQLGGFVKLGTIGASIRSLIEESKKDENNLTTA